MSYDDIQTGPLGRTVEAYEFAQVGEFTRVTSAANAILVNGGTYEPLPGLDRSRPVQGNERNSGDLQITVPASFSIAQLFRGTIPSNFPTLTIFKQHLNDPALEPFTYWTGTIVNCAFGDGIATLFGRTALRVFERPIPRAVYAASCNHQLFDPGCQVVRASFSANLNITSVDSKGTTLTIAGLRTAADAINTAEGGTLTAQEIDDYWNRGIIQTDVSPPEFRQIVETDIGGDPDVVRVTLPFRTAPAGTAIIVAAGCPHSIDFCNRKFSNALNFGGFPYVPGDADNPFNIELDSGRNAVDGVARQIIRGIFT